MISLKKEMIVFLVIFLISSLAVHYSVWFSTPLEHINALSKHPLPLHPIIYVAMIYLIVSVLRTFFALIKRIFKKS